MERQSNAQIHLQEGGGHGESQDQKQHQSLRDKKKEEMKLSQNQVEVKKQTKSNDIYERLQISLKEMKQGHTLITEEQEVFKKFNLALKDESSSGGHSSQYQGKNQLTPLDYSKEKKNDQIQKALKEQTKEIIDEEEEFESKDERIFILRQTSRARLKWDIYMILASMYIIILVPFEIAFQPKIEYSFALDFIESLISLTFFIDIIINFRTSYISSKTGEEIFDTYQIATQYIKSRFIFDLISSIPWLRLAGENQIIAIIQMIKITRISRINEVIGSLNAKSGFKAFLKVLWNIFYLFLFNHVIACLWYYIIMKEEIYVPNKDFVFGGSQYIYEVYSGSLIRRYFISYYIAFYLISIGELCPKTNLELFIASGIFVISSFLIANLFGEMAVLTRLMNAKTFKFQEQLDTVNTAMQNLNLPSWLRFKVKVFFISTQARQDQQEELTKFLETISPTLKLESKIQIYKNVIEENPVLSCLLTSLEQDKVVFKYIISKFEVELSTPEQEFVVQENEVTVNDTNMFFIAKGDCDVMVSDKIGDLTEKKKVQTLLPGSHFGEISLIYGCPRTATVQANNYCTLSKLSKQYFEEIVQKYPQMLPKLKHGIIKYSDNVKLFLEKAIDQISYFKNLSLQALNEVVFSMRRVTYEKGGYLFKIGDVSTQMFIIQSGVVEITHTCDGEPFVIERLYRESVLNHSSFLFADENDANAYCSTTVSVFILSFSELQILRAKYNELDKEIIKMESEMLDKENPIALDYIIKLPKDRRQERDFKVEIKRNALTVQLKNIVMMKWLEVKEIQKKPSIKDILQIVLKQKKQQKEKDNSSLDLNEQEKKRQEKQQKKLQEKLQKEKEESLIMQSYLTYEQYIQLQEILQGLNNKIYTNALTIDQLEKKLIELFRIREEKRKMEENNDLEE